MFIHTLTFLNISKSSPTKTYLAYLTPNLGFIIQLSCSHVSLKMQYMSCSSTLRLPLYFAIILCLCPSLPLSFHYLGFRAGIFLVFCNVLVLHPPHTHTQPALFFSGFLSFRSPCLCRLIPEGSLLISADSPLALATSGSPAHSCTFGNYF